MKKAIIVLLCGFMAMTSGGCKSDDSSTNNTNNFTQTMTATVDGVDWSAPTATAAVGSTSTFTILNIVGQTSTSGTISLVIKDPKKGEFDLLFTENAAGFTIGGKAYISQFVAKDAGKINLTTYSDTEVEGTFSFKGLDNPSGGTTKTITNGRFHLNVTK